MVLFPGMKVLWQSWGLPVASWLWCTTAGSQGRSGESAAEFFLEQAELIEWFLCFCPMQSPAVRHSRPDVDSCKHPCWQQSYGVWNLCWPGAGSSHGKNGGYVTPVLSISFWTFIIFLHSIWTTFLSFLRIQAMARWSRCTQEVARFGRVWRALASLPVSTIRCMNFPSAMSTLCWQALWTLLPKTCPVLVRPAFLMSPQDAYRHFVFRSNWLAASSFRKYSLCHCYLQCDRGEAAQRGYRGRAAGLSRGAERGDDHWWRCCPGPGEKREGETQRSKSMSTRQHIINRFVLLWCLFFWRRYKEKK